jgi:hypothetical protein
MKCAIGGKENDLNIWDLQNNKCVWKAKNVITFSLYFHIEFIQLKNDMLDLRIPVWITDLQYFNHKQDSIVLGTQYAQVFFTSVC